MPDKPPPALAPLWLAHHREHQLDRCLKLAIGRRPVAVCARCAGLYPTLLLTLAVQLWLLGNPGRAGVADWWIAIGAAVPAVCDWGLARLGRPGNNLLRVLTGAGLGLALGRSLLLHFHDPASEVLWVQLLVVGIVALAFELVARFDLD